MIETDPIKFGLTRKQYQLIEEAAISFNEIEKVFIFGSRASGKYQPSSDIDLVVFGNNISSTIINRLASKLDDLPLPFMFDVLNYDKISNKDLKDKIDSESKLFFERNLNTAN